MAWDLLRVFEKFRVHWLHLENLLALHIRKENPWRFWYTKKNNESMYESSLPAHSWWVDIFNPHEVLSLEIGSHIKRVVLIVNNDGNKNNNSGRNNNNVFFLEVTCIWSRSCGNLLRSSRTVLWLSRLPAGSFLLPTLFALKWFVTWNWKYRGTEWLVLILGSSQLSTGLQVVISSGPE